MRIFDIVNAPNADKIRMGTVYTMPKARSKILLIKRDRNAGISRFGVRYRRNSELSSRSAKSLQRGRTHIVRLLRTCTAL